MELIEQLTARGFILMMRYRRGRYHATFARGVEAYSGAGDTVTLAIEAAALWALAWA